MIVSEAIPLVFVAISSKTCENPRENLVLGKMTDADHVSNHRITSQKIEFVGKRR